MFIFIDKNNIDNYKDRLLDFEKSIFISAFPDPNERESFADDIFPRISFTEKDEPQTYCTLALDEEENIIGGLVADWYSGCESLEIIYIAISPSKRRDGIGTHLLDYSIDKIRESIVEESNTIKRIFIEVDIPDLPKVSTFSSENVMDSTERISVWEKWGARRIPINYIQPSLSMNKDPVGHMMLMCLPITRTDPNETIPSQDLKDFLQSFYKGLHAENDPALHKMIDDINMVSRNDLILLESLVESPCAYISEASVTSHFQIKAEAGIRLPETCTDFNSYECDLMNYVNQKKRPFKTKLVKLLTDIPLIMPSFYKYTSEGIVHYYKTRTQELLSDISVSISCPADTDNIDPIAHISIRPSGGSSFSELDFIRMITSFGSRQEDYRSDSDIYFKIDGNLLNQKQILMSLLDVKDEQAIIRTGEGVSQFDIKGIRPYEDHTELTKADFFATLTPEKIKADMFKKVICGLVLGIFDYKRMNIAEVEDTLRPIVTSNDSVIILSRGHIFKIEDLDDDDLKSMQRIIVSPYLLVPSTALAFNGIALEECETLITDILNNRFSLNITKVIQKCETVLDLKYLENIFQYQSEQDIIKEGRKQRSMNERFMKLTHRIDLLKKRTQKSSDIIIEGFLGILATFGIMEVFANEMRWTGIFVILIIAIFGIEAFRWYKVRKMIDLK